MDDPEKRIDTSLRQDRSAERRSDERRRYPRFAFTATADIVEPQSNTHINGRTSDLGEGGCYVDTLSPFPRGTVVRVRISREKQLVEAEAKVAYAKLGMGMGLTFTAIQPEHLRVFRAWILELRGEVSTDREVLSVENKLAADVGGSKEEQQHVLKELIIILMREGVLTELEGKELLRKLNR